MNRHKGTFIRANHILKSSRRNACPVQCLSFSHHRHVAVGTFPGIGEQRTGC